MVSNPFQQKVLHRRSLRSERVLAIVALVNLVLVCFNLSYIPYRDVYLQLFPGLTRWYDPVKGIEPHPETESYLNRVEALEAQVVETGVRSPQVENSLAELRQLSLQMIEDNPFAIANKSNTLGRIHHKMRQRTGEEFARDAFTTFWSQPYLTQAGWQQEIEFWNTQVRPLIQTNYDRRVNRFGRPTDYFWLLDLPFVLIFALDILTRVTTMKRRHRHLTRLEAIFRRWYDLFLLLPFLRWLRVISVSFRLYNVGLLNLEPVQAQVHRDFSVGFAVDLIEMVGIYVIDQMQASVKRGEALHWLLHSEERQPYMQVSPRNEVSAITTRLVNVGVYDVLPQLQPDIKDLLHYSILSTLKQLPLTRQFQRVPGLKRLPAQLTERLAASLSRIAYNSLANTVDDPVIAEITTRLRRNFRDVLEGELRKKHNAQEIQTLVVDLLEEIKLNYIKGIADMGIEEFVDEVEQLRRRIVTPAEHSPTYPMKRDN